ncbi:MAG: DUF1800 domain-containing protein [Acidobacteriota bacterium]|nr:DUF1800 domain-containing protein [Acidobacteriota bacterium]
MKQKFFLIHKITALLMLAAMFSPIFTVGANAQMMKKTSAKQLTEDQKILHVLNRLGFGAREGDVERVKAVGINKYIEQQLNAVSINDQTAEAKVKNLDVLKMSNEELFAKYPSQAAVLLAIAQKNNLDKGDTAQLKNKNRIKSDEMKNTDGAMMSGDNKNADNVAQLSEADRQKYQQEIASLYAKYKLGKPQQITQQLNASRIMRAVYSERQLNEVMVDFWTNHFNVYAGKAATRWFLPEYDRNVIRPNALGNFKDLLTATAQSPAMLFYLDNFQSVSPDAQMAGNNRANNPNRRLNQANQMNAQRREQLKKQYGLSDAELDARIKENQQNPKQPKRMQRGINENYAREVMELHTLGVEGGYTQNDIKEVARAFTGWTIVDPRGYRRTFADVANGTEDKRVNRLMRLAGLPEDAESGTFFFNERAHDKGEKMVLGQKINEGGMKDGLKVVDVLVNHPSTAKFIARKLAVKFVSDTPSEALIGRVARAFQDSKGDIKTTLRAIFTDKEFFAAENYRAKIKTPFEVVISAIRTVGADTNGGQIQALLAKMGEPLYAYQAPTGYPDTAEDWVNTGALLERLNFAVALASNRIPGTRVNLKHFEGRDKSEILNRSIAVVLDGEISLNTKATLLKQLEQPLVEPKFETVADNSDDGDEAMENQAMMQNQGGGGRNRQRQVRLLQPSGNAEVFKVVGLILGTPEFQRQ